jgi:hypothetical protein
MDEGRPAQFGRPGAYSKYSKVWEASSAWGCQILKRSRRREMWIVPQNCGESGESTEIRHFFRKAIPTVSPPAPRITEAYCDQSNCDEASSEYFPCSRFFVALLASSTGSDF